MKKPIKKTNPSSKFDNLKGAGVSAKPAKNKTNISDVAIAERRKARTSKYFADERSESVSKRKAFESRMEDVDGVAPKKPDYSKIGGEIKKKNIRTPKPISAVAPRKKTPEEIAKNSPEVRYDNRTYNLERKSRDRSASIRSRSKAAAKAEIRQTKLITRAVSKSAKEKSKSMVQGMNTLRKVKSLTPEERKVYMNGPAPKVKKRDIPVTVSQVRKKRGGKF